MTEERKTRVRRHETYHHSGLSFGPPSFALIAIHRNGSAIGAIVDSVPDAQYVPHIADTTADGRLLKDLTPDEYPHWSLKPYKYNIVLGTHPVTPQLIAASKLAVAKITAAYRVNFEINRIRARADTGVHLQETVYMRKRQESLEFLRSGCDESLLITMPYLLQYADLYGISPKEAADNILLRANLDDGLLSKTEILRMRFIDRVRRMTDPAELNDLIKQFYFESNSKQLV